MEISNKLKDHILESIGEGVFTVDKNFKINFFNKAAEKITGYSRNEVKGRFCKHIFRSEICFTNWPIALVLQSNNNIYDFDSNIKSKTGKNIPIKLNSAVLYDEKNQPSGGIITFRDLSELEEIKRNIEMHTNFHGVIGQNKHMQEIFQLINEIADSDASVFIQGESGTGKEMIANAIQKTSRRKDKPYIKINCSVIPENLLPSELFGHVKGAFTDAIKDRPGRFELADTGTLFLDEVAEMPLNMQLQMLRVLQEGTFERIGESVTRSVDVRLIAASNMDIDSALRKGFLREDLFYRLNVIPIILPPLRDRKEDIFPLAKHFVNKYSIIYRKEVKDISDKTLDLILDYDWPGNIRELENVIEYFIVRSNNSKKLEAVKLPVRIKSNSEPQKSIAYNFKSESSKRVDILMLLEKHKWNKTKVAKELGIGRTTLWRQLKKPEFS